MPLDLPAPTPPDNASTVQGRAYKRWQTGQAHANAQRWPDAAEQFEQAWRLHADDAYGLAAAHALICAGRAEVAAQRTAELRRRRPQLLLAYTIESHALLERGRPDAAADTLLALPPDVPRDRAYWGALGMSLQRCQRSDEAIAAFLQALAHKMDDGVIHFYLGMAFRDKGMKAEAAECVRTALLVGLGASELSARAQLVFLEREACRWGPATIEMAKLEEALRVAPERAPVETGPFTHAVLGDDPAALLKAARLYALRAESFITPLPSRRPRAHAGRLRIGYLSADFHSHATSQLMVQMLESHDRSRFEVTLFSAGPDDESAMRRRIVASSERFEHLRGRPPAAIARRIRELQIDILIDVKGATFGTLIPVTAHRAAPVQVSWLGFPGTSGADCVDYFIGDRIVSPLANAHHFSEKIAQLPNCYQSNDNRRLRETSPRRAEWDLPEHTLLLCGFHQSYKISEAVFDTWCGILRQLPTAVLWLLRWNTNVESALVAAARARGIAPERLRFAPLVPHDEHMRRLACADIYLDTWPCNAHTTASEAIWVGVPVVTVTGEIFAQRVAASLLTHAGVPELICDTPGQYTARVVALARDAALRKDICRRLDEAARLSPLFDGERIARDLEALYERMWARAVAGLLPDHLPAAAPTESALISPEKPPLFGASVPEHLHEH